MYKIAKIADYNFEFFAAGYVGKPTEDMGEKMRWIEERLTRSISVEITSRLNYTLVDAEPGIYKCTIIIEKIEDRK
jgi:hypothetical protein